MAGSSCKHSTSILTGNLFAYASDEIRRPAHDLSDKRVRQNGARVTEPPCRNIQRPYVQQQATRPGKRQSSPSSHASDGRPARIRRDRREYSRLSGRVNPHSSTPDVKLRVHSRPNLERKSRD
ncbi:Hypothetical protein CINCED_3A002428 [Cinara cedri]|uniref:Uncharacterized protein n=1 Tax=Cinara cedri TaxID=506608 RepID=A0A5E4N1U8_9HEMI|nr:Hypothetical protein CINCED_3A002428 [Cinara cedri]